MNFLARLFNKTKNWQLIGATTTDPQPVTPEILGKVSDDTIQKMLFGTTSYVWEDQDTHDIRKQEVLGSEETSLRQVLSRVDMWGRFEVQLDGKKYIVVKVQSPVLPVVSENPAPILPSLPPISLDDVGKLPVR
jgi:hypothetical protein